MLYFPAYISHPLLSERRNYLALAFAMEVGGEDKTDLQIHLEVEEDSMDNLIKDRFRLSAISIAEAQAKINEMEIGGTVVACVADLAFKYAENVAKDLELFAHHAGCKVVNMDDVVLTENVAKDLELFAHHTGCKVVNMDDVVLTVHKNDNLTASLRSLCNELKAKEPQSDRKRKKGSAKKEDKAS